MKFYKKKSHKLKREDIKNIANLKNSFWKFGIKSQLAWFNNKKNVLKDDFHFYIKKNKKIIGYVQIGKRKFLLNEKKKYYFLFRTLIVSKENRNKKIADKLMKQVSKFINQQKKPCFLLCKKRLIDFYQNYKWIKLNKKKYKVQDHQNNLNAMILNMNNNDLQKNKKFWYNDL